MFRYKQTIKIGQLKKKLQISKKKHIEIAYSYSYGEDSFLRQLDVDMSKVQFLADNCTKVSKLTYQCYLLPLFTSFTFGLNGKLKISSNKTMTMTNVR